MYIEYIIFGNIQHNIICLKTKTLSILSYNVFENNDDSYIHLLFSLKIQLMYCDESAFWD